MTKWYEKTAFEIREAVASGAVSAVEVTRSYLSRIEAVDGQVGAYTQVWHDHALAQAAAIDAKIAAGEPVGAMAGVPVSLKELICTTEGFTTCSSRILQGFRSPYNATVTEKLLAADAVLLGKVNMDEFAMGSSTENSAIQKTSNPWNLDCVPGGSSGGSAASVASDTCAMSFGSDTGGSIRQPAAFCGCVGLKPTYGRVSRYGLVAFASSLDQIGPLTKDVTDTALAMNVICGKDPHDATSADLPAEDFVAGLKGGVKDLRIGLPKEFFIDALGSEVRSLVEASAAVLKAQGAEIVEVSLPHSEYAVTVYYIVAPAEASANLARFDGVRYGFRHPAANNVTEMYVKTKSEGFGPEVQRRIMLGTYVLSSGYYDAYYLKAQKVRRLITQDFDEAFKQCDVILTPTAPTPAFKRGEKSKDPLEMYLNDIFTISTNLAGVPALSMPCGLSASGLPVGVQLIGKAFDEATLLRTAYCYEQHSGLNLGKAAIG
ncbi:MAG: Asp-tRNA(Asn)/Glu-tRNA(Gln) amidotransferase subunit GatA [Candidatus Hydrogenedentes bacterium]|nr:Asp-tRNA(Asn)/Glu-tRNA(Gln) amidotransferase subunit GatA [Candidatus Hydrogenedentota bacterium]